MRWLVLLVMMAALGWGAYTAGERGLLKSSTTADAATVSRLDAFLSEGYGKLLAGDLEAASEQFHKASGLSEDDPTVQEALVLVDVLRAQAIYWKLAQGEDLAQLATDLDVAVDRARQSIAAARRKVSDPQLKTRLTLHERRLNTFVVIGFARAGNTERAKGALEARLVDHPQRKLLQALVGSASPDLEEPQPSASASASASAASSPAAPSPPTAGFAERDDHYEFDHEPPAPPKSAGELQLPGNAPSPTPPPAPIP